MRSLRDFTSARVDLGRAGDSLPTSTLLELRLAQAKAQDAVHLALDGRSLAQELTRVGSRAMILQSQALNRQQYLLRPDLGRTLSDASVLQLSEAKLEIPVVFCVGDGLSAAAVHRHAIHLLSELGAASPVIFVEQARVAVGDCVGQMVKAEVCVMLIGERPGLSSPDSLGVYITYQPRPGCTDAARNCVSNIHQQGLSYRRAAETVQYLVQEARRRKLTGVELKDRTSSLPAAGEDG